MNTTNFSEYKRGTKDGIPIALGYFAVAFSLGIIARKAGITALQSFVISATNAASAGEYVGFTLIYENAAYLELALMTLVANARYILLSCALTQKFAPDMKFIHRFFLGFCITDEIFGISIAVKDRLNPWYTYGAAINSLFFWSLGTALGVIMGNLLPSNIVSALSVGLYGMFIAIIIPPARKDKIVAVLVVISMVSSYIVTRLPIFAAISSGTRTIILTVLISSIAAIAFPVKAESEVANES